MASRASSISTKLFTAHSAGQAPSSGSFMKELFIGDIVKKRDYQSPSSFTRFYTHAVVTMLSCDIECSIFSMTLMTEIVNTLSSLSCYT